jgi:hypothetical protein
VKTSRVVCILAIWIAARSIGSAADFSGNWVAQQMREGRAATIAFDFKVNGDKLTGTVSPAGRPSVISEGKVSGNNISFAIVRTVDDNISRVDYTGALSGDELKIVASIGGRKVLDCTAKRSK